MQNFYHLENLVRELCEADSLPGVEPGLDAIPCRHSAEPEVPPRSREKFEHVDVLVPFIVVDDHQVPELLAAGKVLGVVLRHPREVLDDALNVPGDKIARWLLGLPQGGVHEGAIQGKEGIKFCSAA